jgi:peptidoglycan/LPS O-acetylase OafA/YrhL
MYPAESREKARQTFAQVFDPRENAFAFLRLVLAVLVIVGHTFPLGGFGSEPSLPALTGVRHSLGDLSVGMFFVLSGFLICRSASGSLSVGRFLWHRFLRIFPGFWMCLLVCAFVFAPIACAIEYGSLFEVFRSPRHSAQSYLISNAAMFHARGFSMNSIMAVSSSHIAGLLGHNPLPWIINGSLWTLPIELLCYLAIAGLAALGVMQRARIVVLAIFALWCGLYGFNQLSPAGFRHYFPDVSFTAFSAFCLYFFAGAVCFLYREKIPYSKALFIGSIGLAGVSLTVGALGWLIPITLPYAFLCLGFKLPAGHFDAKGDFSYGAYIYAFPVQQGLALAGVHEAGVGLYLICSLLITGVLAVLSYRLVEAPCLRWKNFDLRAAFRPSLRQTQKEPITKTLLTSPLIVARTSHTSATAQPSGAVCRLH